MLCHHATSSSFPLRFPHRSVSLYIYIYTLDVGLSDLNGMMRIDFKKKKEEEQGKVASLRAYNS